MPWEPLNIGQANSFTPIQTEVIDEPITGSFTPLPIRFGKQLTNIFSKSIKEIAYGVGGGKIASYVAAAKINKTLRERGIDPPSLRETQKKFKQAVLGEYEKGVPEFDISPATTVGEKATDIAAGVTGFVAQLAILKKAFPGVSGSALWEMENLSSGGTPGVGAATYGVFNLPGKVIKGVSVAAKAGRVVSESALLGGLSAVHQKIETGEIDAIDVLISAGIPIGLRAAGGAKGILKRALKAKNPKAIKAVNEVTIKTPEKPIEAQTPAERVQTTNQQLIEAVTTSKLLTSTEVKAAHKALRRRQVGRGIKATRAALRAGRPAGEAIRAGRKAYGGKSKVPKMTPPDLTPAQWEGYNKKILEAYPLNKKRVQFQRTGAQEALDKLRTGDIPTNYEIGLLEPVLGTETATKLFEALQSKKGLELWDIPTLIRDVPKALRFGFDPQAARGLSKVTIRHPLIYLSALGKNIRGIFSKKYTDAISKTIEASPAYKLGQKEYGTNYLSMKPWASVEAGTKLEQYGHISDIFRRSNNRVIKGIGTWLRASERGANLGMNDALNKLVIKGEKDLARYSRSRTLSDKQISSWRKARGHDINIFTKRITMKHPKGKAIQRAANWLVFSPSYTASGLASGPQSFIRLATGKGFASRTYAMQIMLSRLAGLTAASSAIGYVGHKWRLKNPTEEPPIDSSANPIDPLFGKVRHGLEVYDLGFGDVADYRLIARIGLSAYMGAKKLLTGKEITSIGGKKIPTAGESFGRYLESKRTLYISLAKQLATGKDWLGNSVTLKDTALDNLPFEFFQAFVEAGAADGLWESMAEGIDLDTAKKTLGNLAPAIAALGGVGTGSYPTYTSVTRSKFRNVIAKREYGKRWDILTQTEQRKLSTKHRKAFSAFEQKIKVERIEKPANLAAIQEEQRKSGVKITKLLSKSNREKIKDVSVKVSRRPKNFYLNDERYQQYQELVAEYINERLSRINLAGKSDKVRIRMLEITVKMAKAKAFRDIRRGMR